MRKFFTMTVMVLTMAMFSSPTLARGLPNLTKKAMIRAAKAVGAQVEQLDRVEISTSQGMLAHYTVILKVGDGEYDKIGVHRVVREFLPGIPEKTKAGIFCLHGDCTSFNLIYMPTTLPDPSGSGLTLGQIINNPDNSLGIFLAQQGIDVWGIDLRWALIPPWARPWKRQL